MVAADAADGGGCCYMSCLTFGSCCLGRLSYHTPWQADVMALAAASAAVVVVAVAVIGA